MRLFLVTLSLIMLMVKLLKLYLNKNQRDKGLPDELKGFYSKHQYNKWMRYENVTDNYAVIKLVIHFIFDCILILSPFYCFLSSLFDQDVLLNSLGMICVMYVFESLVGMIEEYYRIFKIEEKFGMNKTTIKTFIGDSVKEFVIDILMIIILVLFVHYFYKWFSFYGFVVLFIVIGGFVTIIQKNGLRILRIYNQFTPLEDGEFKNKIYDLVSKQGFKLKGVYIMDASKRTTRANAFCLGDKEKEICIDDNMFKNYSDKEILAVFSHELGHAVYNHNQQLKLMNYFKMTMFFILFIVVVIDPTLYRDFGINQLNYYMIMILLSHFISPLMFLLDIPASQLSRKCEYEADEFAAGQGYGIELANILKKLTKNSLSDVLPHPLVVKLTYSHPSLIERVNKLKKP